MSYYGYPKYVSVAQKRAKAEKKIKQLQKKNPDIRPVIIEGNNLARTWWGKSWNKNLESYADYSNRIGRGRSYVRHLAVVDLQITPGKITALVQGSQGNPYKVVIAIKKMKQKNWQAVRKECQAQLSSLPDLLAGKFPKALQETFMRQGEGLFPTPEEISFDCSCPDWASMCKHVAASLYGVGARLDEDPALFFTLRQVNMDDLITQAVQDKTASILKGGAESKGNVIADDQLEDLFGISMDAFDPGKELKKKAKKTAKKPGPTKKRSAAAGKKKAPAAKKPRKKAAEEKSTEVPEALRAVAEKLVQENKRQEKVKQARKKSKDELQGHPTVTALVTHCLDNSADGLSTKELEEKTGLPARKLYGALANLKKQGKAWSPAWGVYKCR
ncbi:hypothetical protein VU01_10458 [Candidatus Electrothrix marina]|uniref:SWIM-type domain-containing protein n=1 Tax=Candidatus Electrothrix marina TaxID=1859130 RepID=A0A444JG48_9BACT|nr:hypothetical protein VU01_10458 [Candidatus Electrothrix marina]